MAARQDTWMPIYWGDYLRDTMHLTAEGHGAYLLLIAAYWTSGASLPDDDDYLMTVARLTPRAWRKLKPTLAAFFQLSDGAWRHRRIDAEIERTSKITKARQEAGKRGGKKKANNLANAKQKPTPSQPPIPSKKESTSNEVPKNIDNDSNSMKGNGHAKRGARLPNPWPLDDKNREFARSCGHENAYIDRTLHPEFCDYWWSESGARACKLDWDGTWRNRCRAKAEQRPKPGGERREAGGIVAAARSLMDRDHP